HEAHELPDCPAGARSRDRADVREGARAVVGAGRRRPSGRDSRKPDCDCDPHRRRAAARRAAGRFDDPRPRRDGAARRGRRRDDAGRAGAGRRDGAARVVGVSSHDERASGPAAARSPLRLRGRGSGVTARTDRKSYRIMVIRSSHSHPPSDTKGTTMFTSENWPIGANMLSFGNRAPDGTPMQDASSAVWAGQLRQVRDLGVTQVDPTDAWLPLAQLSDARIDEFPRVLDGEGMSLSSISMTRNSVVDVEHGERNLAHAKRFVEIAPHFGVDVVNTGFMQALTLEQNAQIWFWLVDGHKD